MKLTRLELSERYNISKNMWTRRREDLLDHLADFMDIEEVKEGSRFFYIVNDDAPDKIPPIPRKSYTTNKSQKIKDYETYAIAALGTEFKPNSKTKIARDAIIEFGYDRYGHTSERSVARRYVGPVVEEKGEKSERMVWVDYTTYEILDNEMLDCLFKCFKDVDLDETAMADAFVKQQQGGDITIESNNFKSAIDRFKELYGFVPIKVYKWKLKG